MTHPYTFEKPELISKALEGSEFFVATYWVRFDNFKISRDSVVDNAKKLVDCAKEAGVERYVYTSHTQSDENCHIPYIAGKAQVENYVKQ